MAIATSTIVALALAAAAAGGTYYSQQSVAKKQDQAAAASIRQQSARQQKADAEVNRLVDDRATSSSSDERASSLQQYMQAARAANPNATNGTQQVGKLSEAAQQAGADASLGVSNYGQKMADLLSRIDAPGLARRNEAVREGRFATAIDQIKRFSAGDQFLNDLRMRNIRSNPWIDAAAAFAGGASSGMAGTNGNMGVGWGGV